MVLAAVAATVVACGGGDGPAPPSGGSSAPAASPATPVVSPATSLPPNTIPPAVGFGAIMLRTVTLSGAAVPDVPVHISLRQPCDPARLDIPVGETREALRQDAVTDATGSAVFTAPLGCYQFGMRAPAGTSPVPEGMHSAFVVESGQVVTGLLRFQEPGLPPTCATETIVRDLDVSAEFRAARTLVSECDGAWAVIAWDLPGDTQRIVRRANAGPWTTYAVFPHDICWAEAMADGVPDRLRKYFPIC